MTTIQFLSEPCTLAFAKYQNGRVGILLYSRVGEPMGKATVNLPGVPMAEDEIAIKNYSENEGMLESLTAAGIVSEPRRYVLNGLVSIPICRLLVRE